MNKRHLYAVVLLLVAFGLGLFGYKIFFLNFPLTPDTQNTIWNLETKLTFQAHERPAKITLLIPKNTRRYALVDENFLSPGYGLTTSMTEDGNRRAVWSIRKAKGRQTLYYRAVLRRINTTTPPHSDRPPAIMPSTLTSPHRESALALINEIRQESSDVETFVGGLIRRLHDRDPDDAVKVLFGNHPTDESRIHMTVQLLLLAGIPARPVHGFQLDESNNTASRMDWFQVFEKDRWLSFSPLTPDSTIPDEFITWWRGNAPLFQGEGVSKLQFSLAVSPNQEEAIQSALVGSQLANPSILDYSLFSLPLHVQAVYRVLLMVPLGALLLVILRNVVGIKTFGTFMPILIGLAFRETQLLWGLVLFSLVVGLGLAVRFYLEHLKLLLVPRLASVLIVVVLLMAMLSILSHKLGLDRGLSIALFPMVILTMTIERMCIVWDERGAGESLQQGLGSLAVATLTYLTMTIPYLEHLLFVFPELLLLILAGTLLLGRYSGFRLLELRRFRALAAKPSS